MASNTIKGITVAIGGDTTELNNSMEKIEKSSKETQKELNLVNKALKFDPSNTVLLTQKQELLAEQVGNVREKLSNLESIQNDVQKAFESGDLGAEQYRAFQREVEYCKSRIETLGKQSEETEKKLDDTGNEADDTGKELKEMGKNAADSETKFDSLKNASKSLASKGLDAVKTSAKAVAAGVAAAGAAAIKVSSEVVEQYGELEQNLGGAESVFGNHASKLENISEEAYKTMGTSQSDYLATANKMGALFQGSGVKQERSLELTTQAMQRAADMASVMGISTESALEAVTGAAKGNYTMMDNIGVAMNATTLEAYAMSQGYDKAWNSMSNAEKAEVSMKYFFEQTQQYAGNFERESTETITGSIGLLKSATSSFMAGLGNSNADIQNLTSNIIDAFDSVVDNIHPILKNVIKSLPTVTNTIINSLDNMAPELLSIVTDLFSEITKVLTALAPKLIKLVIEIINTFVSCFTDPEILSTLLNSAVDIISTIITGLTTALPDLISALLEILPTVLQSVIDALILAIPQIIEAVVQIVTAIAEAIPIIIPILVEALPQIINSILTALITAIPQIINAGIQLLTAIIGALPDIIKTIVDALPEIIENIITGLLNALPQLIEAGITLFLALIEALPEIIIAIVEALPQIIDGIINGLLSALPQLIDAGVQLFVALIENTPKIIMGICEHIPEIITGIVNGFASLFDKMCEIGGNILEGLWQGICDGAEWLWNCISGFCEELWGKITDFFGIHSPSRLFRDELGKNLMLGWSIGIDDNSKDVMKSISDVSSGIEDISQNSVISLQDNLSDFDGFNANIKMIEPNASNAAPYSENNTVESPVNIYLNFGGVTLSSGYDTDRFADDIMSALGSKITTDGMAWG